MGEQKGSSKVNENNPLKESAIAPERVALGGRLREVRTALSLTIERFAAHMEVSKRTQIAYEDGSRCPDADYLARLFELHVDLQYLITGTPSTRVRDLSSGEVRVIERLRGLSPRMRRTVDEVLTYAWASKDLDPT